MNYLLLALGLLLTTTAHAQTAAPTKYCLLYTRGGAFHSLGLRLDFGQDEHKEFVVQDAALTALADQIKEMHSVPVALSYLDSKGWELVQTAALPDGQQQGSVGFLLRRKP